MAKKEADTQEEEKEKEGKKPSFLQTLMGKDEDKNTASGAASLMTGGKKPSADIKAFAKLAKRTRGLLSQLYEQLKSEGNSPEKAHELMKEIADHNDAVDKLEEASKTREITAEEISEVQEKAKDLAERYLDMTGEEYTDSQVKTIETTEEIKEEATEAIEEAKEDPNSVEEIEQIQEEAEEEGSEEPTPDKTAKDEEDEKEKKEKEVDTDPTPEKLKDDASFYQEASENSTQLTADNSKNDTTTLGDPYGTTAANDGAAKAGEEPSAGASTDEGIEMVELAELAI